MMRTKTYKLSKVTHVGNQGLNFTVWSPVQQNMTPCLDEQQLFPFKFVIGSILTSTLSSHLCSSVLFVSLRVFHNFSHWSHVVINNIYFAQNFRLKPTQITIFFVKQQDPGTLGCFTKLLLCTYCTAHMLQLEEMTLNYLEKNSNLCNLTIYSKLAYTLNLVLSSLSANIYNSVLSGYHNNFGAI